EGDLPARSHQGALLLEPDDREPDADRAPRPDARPRRAARPRDALRVVGTAVSRGAVPARRYERPDARAGSPERAGGAARDIVSSRNKATRGRPVIRAGSS